MIFCSCVFLLSTYALFISDIIVLSVYLFVNDLDRLLPLPKDYISDNFNLAQLPPIVERIGYQAMGDDAIHVAKALQQQRIATTEAASASASAAVITNNGSSSTAAGQPIRTIAQQKSSSSLSYPIYRRALRLILNEGIEDDQDDTKTDEDLIIPPYAIQKAAEALYLMIHARFVISPRGLEAIRQVMTMDNTVFGKCPRSTCRGTGLLPYGYSNDYTSANTASATTSKSSLCHRYCPSCGEVWISWDSKTDGCAWGPSWCHLFLMCFGSQVYAKELIAAAAAAVTMTAVSATTTPTNASRRTPYYNTSYAPTFLPRSSSSSSSSSSGARDFIGSDNSTNQSSDSSSSCPTPSVFGFRIHPATSFGRPLNEQTKSSLRGGSSNEF